MKRGDVVIVSAPGDFGKPRPAVIIQSDAINETHATISVCLMTSELHTAPLMRIDVAPDKKNGLRVPSQVMVDKIITLKRERVSEAIGRLDEKTLLQLNRMLAVFIGIA